MDDLNEKDQEYEDQSMKDEIRELNTRIIDLETELRLALGKASKSKSTEYD